LASLSCLLPRFQATVQTRNWLRLRQSFEKANPTNTTMPITVAVSPITCLLRGYLNMAVVWDAAQCSLAEVYLRFRSACCLHHQDDEHSRLQWERDIWRASLFTLLRKHSVNVNVSVF
jgi:hypothetical protein